MVDLVIGDKVTGVGIDYLENYTVISRGINCVVILSESGEYEYLFEGEDYVLGETIVTDGGFIVLEVGGS